MRKMMGGLVVLMVVAGSTAMAGTLTGVKAWADRAGKTVVAQVLAAQGITNSLEQAMIVADWDEDAVIDGALRRKAFPLIDQVMGYDKLTTNSMQKVKEALLVEKEMPAVALSMVKRYPVEERLDFAKGLEPIVAARYPKTPENGRLFLKYTVLRDLALYGAGVSEEDWVRWLLAGEPMDMTTAQTVKEAIKARAVVLARLKLRAEGKSFVVKNGVNPLVAKVQPVVEALNAPECAGLEEALRGLGCNLANVDRTPMRKVAAVWREELMRGDLLGSAAAPVVGKVAVALGSEGYKRFVDVYNNGTAGAQ
jgi:hypothetical protein